MIKRYLRAFLEEELLRQGHSVVLYGPRQVGKTTLAKTFLEDSEVKYYNLDDFKDRALFENPTLSVLSLIVENKKRVIVDEAQRVKNIGLSLKLLIDGYPNVQFLITGSSSLDLAQGITEPLTGRVFEYIMYPISLVELLAEKDKIEVQRDLDNLLIYGAYPKVVNEANPARKKNIIEMLSHQYLFKDTLAFSSMRNPEFLRKLLELLAFQVGSEVSIAELAANLSVDAKTVRHYIDICEKLFILFSLRPYSRNKRKAISKQNKYYFFDLGVRNELIKNFNSLNLRNDLGQLWENFVIVERMKFNASRGHTPNYYFYRTYGGAELDLIEEYNDQRIAFECKYSKGKVTRNKHLLSELKLSSLEIVNKHNFFDFLS